MYKAGLWLLLLVAPLFSSSPDGNTIPWSATRRLTWSDFKSRPDNNATNAALTSSKIVFNFGYGGEKGFNYTISCEFDKNGSWGRIKTDYILAHEQGHFDIAEIFARKLNKSLRTYRFNANTVQKEVPNLYQDLMKEETAWQNQYDNETDYSRNHAQQERWLEKIDRELSRLSQYADYAK